MERLGGGNTKIGTPMSARRTGRWLAPTIVRSYSAATGTIFSRANVLASSVAQGQKTSTRLRGEFEHATCLPLMALCSSFKAKLTADPMSGDDAILPPVDLRPLSPAVVAYERAATETRVGARRRE